MNKELKDIERWRQLTEEMSDDDDFKSEAKKVLRSIKDSTDTEKLNHITNVLKNMAKEYSESFEDTLREIQSQQTNETTQKVIETILSGSNDPKPTNYEDDEDEEEFSDEI